jgi:hypothetical protein
VTRGGGVYALESLDGEYLFYSKTNEVGGVWRVRASGGEETELLSNPVGWGEFVPTRSGLYFVTAVPAGASSREYTILHLDFLTGRVTDLYRAKGGVFRSGLAVSPDEKWILYGERPPDTSELMLVENFR